MFPASPTSLGMGLTLDTVAPQPPSVQTTLPCSGIPQHVPCYWGLDPLLETAGVSSDVSRHKNSHRLFFYNRLSFPTIILTALPYTCFILNLPPLNTGDQPQASLPVSNTALYPPLPEISPQKNLWTFATVVTTHLGSSYFFQLLSSSAADKLASLLTAASSAVQLRASDFMRSLTLPQHPDTSTISLTYLFFICCDSL